MKKYLAGLLIVACLGTFSWAQGNKPDLFDTAKSAQELEIMKGILGTTLSFVAQNLQKQEAAKASTKQVNTPFGTYSTAVSWRSANINAFYLYGQGAVFIMPTSSLRISGFGSSGRGAGGNLDVYYLAQERLTEATARDREVRAQVADAVRAATVPPQAAKAPTAPAPPAPVQLKEEELRKKVAEAQERVKKSREEIEANQAKFLAALEQIKVHLVEAIANHGDSMTTVKPNEYISLVIMTDDMEFRSEIGQRNRQQVISVQKSLITEYKAGRLTLDALKQKILQYNE
jgi:hypothetical protein